MVWPWQRRPRPPTPFIQPPRRAAPRTSHPQDDLPGHLPGAVRNFAEQLFGVVFPGEGGGEVQVVANPARIQLDVAGYRRDLGAVALPAQDNVTHRADVRCGAPQDGPLPLSMLLAGGNAWGLKVVWGRRAEGGKTAWGRQLVGTGSHCHTHLKHSASHPALPTTGRR